MKSDRSMGDPPVFSSGGGEPSSVSIRSDWSMGNPPVFSRAGGEPSCLSVKSDWSMGNPPVFSSAEGEPSCVSVKSDWSMGNPPVFSSAGGERSCVSMKSDRSMGNPPVFSSGGGEPSCVSVKSDWSMGNSPVFSSGGGEPNYVSKKQPPGFSSEPLSSDPEQNSTETALQINTLVEETENLHLDSYHVVNDVLNRVLEAHKTSMKNKYESLFEGIKTEENKTLLNRIYTQLYIIEGESEGVNEEHEVLQMDKTSRKHLQDIPINCLDIFEEETEKQNIRAVRAKRIRQNGRKEDEEPKQQKIKTVLTKGIAGIGKTVSVQKFVLDWAEGKANQDVDFMIVLPFRELNLIKDDQYSLHGLLCGFHPELKDLNPEIYDQIKAVFIFDGLDESRIPLNFEQCEKVSDITMTSSVGVLMTNLIKGELLPSALIWITSRPAAANQIPPKYINRVTEIQGFSDPQKEEYFRKRISDEDQAQRIISHIKTVRSLHIMCHIPVFCWISATVLQRIMKQPHTEIPKTLTEMYSHFLITQTNMKNEKYEEKEKRDQKKLLESNRIMILKLAELAFKQLMKGNVMFHEEDLRECGIEVTEASVHSGIFTEIFREECVLFQKKVYSFVHLSFQEFLAAVFVFHCCESKIMEPLQCFKPRYRGRSENFSLDELLEGSLHKALESQNGHLDLFLRFLLGISLESNQRLLQGLLIHTQRQPETIKEYIKEVIKKNTDEQDHISTERSINLFFCLSEMNDQTLFREIEEYLKSEKHSEDLSPPQCSALAYMILNTEEVMDELYLRKYTTSEEGYRRLIPAVTLCRKALLAGCNLNTDSLETICSALQSANCPLKDLNLSSNDLQDSGVELLSAGLKSSHCKLEKLRLASCNLNSKACDILSSILQSANVSLTELDLSNNDLQDSGVELLSAGLKISPCTLEILRLASCNLNGRACETLSSILHLANYSLKELDLSSNDLKDSGVELLSAGLKISHCTLEILRLSGCMVTDEGCSSLASALKSNPSHLRELDLSYNHPGESGVKLLSDLLEDPHCTLEKLQVDHGGKIRMKPGVKKYAVDLTLDPNTVNSRLSLSEGNRKVERLGEDQSYSDHSDSLDECDEVLSVERLTGRCYWEVQWSREADISVSYRGIRRKEGSDECEFRHNNQSWSLWCSDGIGYSVFYNNVVTFLPAPASLSNRVGVYLDWGSGTLSFYTISPDTHTLTHLHTLYTTFTEPLYAGFCVDFDYIYDSSVRLCEIE
ncbi:NACHT, LRR and PYD domains-containing protein 12-like [Colossoma macropomum]|uniref:NACHT, LRR and PYD domains-containing protein 12-like n=1 Tax=Colossoma macropomum TaxID=42526 RepID=UPI001864FE6D|nr:NACHT, LRR and PYD domains-containing protein 12-like [Colossoma macropomum]